MHYSQLGVQHSTGGKIHHLFLLFPRSSSAKQGYKQIINQTTDRSHNLNCPCYSRVTIALLYLLKKALRHLYRQVIIRFTCICSDFCHHLQGVESYHDSSCLQVIKASLHPGPEHCQVELLCWRQEQLTPAHIASLCPCCLLPCLLATPSSSLCLPLPSPVCFQDWLTQMQPASCLV